MSDANIHTVDEETPEPAIKAGPEVIRSVARTAPNKPGVYRMLGADGEVLYVGKAKSVKKRIQSYTRLGGHTNRIARMIASTVSMEIITTASEAEALLLEANLIKKLAPRYNINFRDDKSFPYILISHEHAVSRVVKHRGARKRDGEYFGPFASAGAVNRTINALQRAFLLRSCTDSVYESRTRPCLLYQIKRCSGPCTGEISGPDHEQLVSEALEFLSGKSGRVKDHLAVLMEDASSALDFEQAAVYRDRISALSHVQGHQGINPHTITEADVFAIAHEGGQFCVQVFFFRAGQNWGNRAFFPRADKSHTEAEVLEAFLAQFYDDKPCPKKVLLSHDVAGRLLLADALTIKSSRKVAVSVPRRGEKLELVAHAQSNAREALGRRMAESASQRKLLHAVADTFGLDQPPERIEVYDNSHIQGAHPVGGMVVAGPEGFIKNQYRKFNIKDETIVAGDDYAMMREVMTRRFSRLLKEEASNEESAKGDAGGASLRPDLVLIDGGPGQLSAVLGVLNDLGLDDLNVVGIAKGPDRNAGREHFHVHNKSPFMLERRDPVLYYVQRLRDEAHRFAIGSHRARRKKAIGVSPLDEIGGIGAKRKRALLHHFGSAKAVARASGQDLAAVDGISSSLAQTIYEYFHEGQG